MPRKFKWMAETESAIEDAIMTYLHTRSDVLAFKIDTRANFDARLGVYRRLHRHVLPGTPDIICCLSVAGMGILVGLEVKTATGRQSEHQKRFETMVRAQNGHYFVVRSIDDAQAALEYVKMEVQIKSGVVSKS